MRALICLLHIVVAQWSSGQELMSPPGAEPLPGNSQVFIYRDTVSGTMGLLKANGERLTVAAYDEISVLSDAVNDYFQVLQGDRWGILHESGMMALPVGDYYINTTDAPRYFTVGTFDGKSGVFHNGRMIIPLRYEEDIMFYVKSDSSGTWIDHIRAFERLTRKAQVIVLFDSAGNRLNPSEIRLSEMETTGLGGYYQILNRKLRGVYQARRGVIVPAQYEYIEDVYGGENEPQYFLVEKKGRYGLYGPDGRLLLPLAYTFIEPVFSESALFQAMDPQDRLFELRRDYTVVAVQEDN